MLCSGKYYVGCSVNLQVQVSKEEHERIRNVRKEPLVEVRRGDAVWVLYTWIDDASCDRGDK